MIRPTWDQRIARAGELAEIFPFAAKVLGFYAGVARYQKALYGYIQQARGKSPLPGHSFRDSLDLVLLLPRFPGFLKVVREAAPAALSSLAEHLPLGRAVDGRGLVERGLHRLQAGEQRDRHERHAAPDVGV